jgi:hypothetical protein
MNPGQLLMITGESLGALGCGFFASARYGGIGACGIDGCDHHRNAYRLCDVQKPLQGQF